MRFAARFAALLIIFALTPLSSPQISASSDIGIVRNTSSTLAQVGPRAGFTVTSLADTTDPGTLRTAITTANATPEPDIITFAVTGSIALASSLPQINQPLTITGPGADQLTITATTPGSFTAFQPILGAGSLTISGLTITAMNHGVYSLVATSITLTDMVISSMNARAVTASGSSLAMTRVTVIGNIGQRAFYAANTTVTMTNSTISGSAQNAMQIDGGTVTITGSTFTNNTGASAGAIYANGATIATVVNITNSTFSGNVSTSTNNADAIYAFENATVNIAFSTFSGHSNSTATSTTGIIHAGTNADIVLLASVIANNPAGGIPRECTAGTGATFTGSGNLTNDTVCPGRIAAPTNVSGTLADNGGSTRTHALLAGSTAIDAYTGSSCPANDQRSLPRPAVDTDCDLGAYEFGAVLPAPEIEVTGNGVVIADGDITPSLSDHTDYGTTTVGTPVTRIFTIRNTGSAALTISGLSFSSPYMPVAPDLFPLIAPGSLTTFGLQCSAESVGTYTSTIVINSDDADEASYSFDITCEVNPPPTPEIEVTGNGVAIADGDTTPSLSDHTDYGTTTVGTPVTRIFTIRNTGSAALTISGLSFSSPYVPVAPDLFPLIAPGNSTTFGLQCSAESVGTYTGTIVIDSDDADEASYSFDITCEVNPVPAPEIAISGNGMSIPDGHTTPSVSDHTDFGTTLVGSPVTRTFTIENSGTAALVLTSIEMPSGYMAVAPLPETTIPAGQSTTVSYRCLATAAGIYTRTITIESNDADESPYTFTITCQVDALVSEINVTGSGENIADGDDTPVSVNHTDFGMTPAGTPVTRTFTIQNTGTAPLNLGTITVPSGFTVAMPLPGPVVTAGGSAALNIQCDAAMAGLYFGSVSIENDDANENPYNFDIACMVSGPEIDVFNGAQPIANGDPTPSPTDGTNFGTLVTGAPSGQIFTLVNTGTSALEIGSVTVPAGFSINIPSAPSIAMGTSSSLGVRCDATAAGIYSGAVSISSNDANENPFTFAVTCEVIAPDINLTGNGVNIANGDAAPTTADHSDFGTTLVGTSVTRTFTIENNGAGTLSLGIPVIPAGFSVVLPTPAFNILPGQSTSINLRCDAAAEGVYSGSISLPNNDPDENPYTFAVSCTVDAPPPLVPDIVITGNSVVIANGDITPSLADHTDFGTTAVGSPVTRSFTIFNNGSAILGISNATIPTGFMPVMPFPDVLIAAGGSTTLNLECPATAPLAPTGTLMLQTNDPDTPEYSFTISCEVIELFPPDINITGNGITIANGDTTPDVADHTDFGVTTIGTPVMRTFTIENTGTGTLMLTGASLTASGFTGAGTPPSITIPAGESTTFSLVCEALAVGGYSSTVSINTNDSDENPYLFDITCQVDNIPAGVTVTETSGTTAVTEVGDTDSYTVVLDRQPTADVTVTLTFDGQITANGSSSPLVLTFTSANWNIVQTVTIAAVNDSLVEGAHNVVITLTASSADAAYNAIDPADVSVSITDNDTAQVLFPAAGASVAENITPYSQNAVLSITSDPIGGTLAIPVAVELLQTPGSAATPADYTLTTTSLTYPVGAANAATQLYEVAILNDSLDEPDETFTLSFGTVTGPATASGTHVVTILDDDVTGVTVTETGGTTVVTESDGTDGYTVALTSQPTAVVTVTLAFDDQIMANGSASPLVLTFSNMTPQTVTIAPVNDSLVEGAHSVVITQTASSADAAYNAIDPSDVSVSITDNDTATVLFPAAGASVSENITPYSQNAVLSITSDPIGGTLAVPVTVELLQTPGSAATPSDYTLTTTSLTFPVGSANAAAQLYAIAIVSDSLDEPDETFTLSFGTVTGPATAAGTHALTILDDDVTGVTVAQTSGTTAVTEAGGTDSYTVALTSRPTAGVTVTLIFDGQITANGSASPLLLAFSDMTPQTVTIAAVNDSLVEGAHGSAISYAVASADSGYNGQILSDTIVAITDNDMASLTLENATGSATEGVSPYTVNAVLNIVSDPVGGTLAVPVTADLLQTPGSASTPADYALTTTSLTFPAGAAHSAVQPISVGIVDDALPENDESFVLSFGTSNVPASGTHTVTILASDLGNLLQNPGFEIGASGITKAANWASTVLTMKDKRVCNTAAKTFSNSGSCAFRFQYTGLLAASRVAKQTVKNPVRGIVGENYTLDAMVSAVNLTPGAKLILMVKYANGTNAKAVINLPSGSFAYTPVHTVLPITRNVAFVRVILRGGTAFGRLLIDDLVLWVEPATAATAARSDDALLPPPAAPDGFRSSSTMP